MKIAYVEHPCESSEALDIKLSGFDKVRDLKFAPDVLDAGCEVFLRDKSGALKKKTKPKAKK